MKIAAIALALTLSSCSALSEHQSAYASLSPEGQAKIDSLAEDLSDLSKAILSMDLKGAVKEGIEASVSAVGASHEKNPIDGEEIGVIGAIALAISSIVTALRHKLTGPDPRVQKRAS